MQMDDSEADNHSIGFLLSERASPSWDNILKTGSQSEQSLHLEKHSCQKSLLCTPFSSKSFTFNQKKGNRSTSKPRKPSPSICPRDIDLENIRTISSRLTTKKKRNHPSDIIKSDNLEHLKEIFNKISDEKKVELLVEKCDEYGGTYIAVAVDFRRLKCLQYLLETYSSIIAKFKETTIHPFSAFLTNNKEWETVLHMVAARPFDAEILNLFSTNDNVWENINYSDRKGNTPLLISTKRRNFDMSEYLVEHGAKIDSLNLNHQSPIGICLENNDWQLLRCFLENVPEDEVSDLVQNGELFNGHTILFPLITVNGPEISYSVLKEMLNESILQECFVREILDIDFVRTFCCIFRQQDVVEELMELNSDFITVKGEDGMTPLLWASSSGNFAVMSKILSDPSSKMAIRTSHDNQGKNFVHHSVQFNCLGSMTQEILDKLRMNTDFRKLLNEPDRDEYTPLHHAVTKGYSETVGTLITLGASPDILGPKAFLERPLLHYAVYSGITTVASLVETVMEVHGDEIDFINKEDCRKETALHVAAGQGKGEVTAYLLSRKASIKCDYKGRTPLHIAAKRGSEIAAEILLDYKPSIIDDKDYVEKTALMAAAENGNVQVVEFLLSRQANITKNSDGQNCLDYAVDNDWPEVAIAIIDANPPVWQKALEESRNGSQHIVSKMVKSMGHVACRVFDKYISKEPTDKNQINVTYDLALLQTPSTDRCNIVLETMVEHRAYDCLNHPLMKKMLTYTFNSREYVRLRRAYYISLFLYLFFLISFTTYIGIVRQGDADTRSPELLFLTVICVSFSIICLLIEIGQFLRGKMLYIHEMNNYLELVLYSSTMIFFVPVGSEKSSKQWHAGAIGIFLAWIRFIWFLKFFPAYGIYIIMAMRVFFTVLKVLPMVILFLIAFAIAFFVIFPEDPGFSSLPLSFLLALLMMTGEIEFRDKFLAEKSGPFFELRLIILVVFLLIILIVVMNLFTGLAVGDTSEVLSNSEREKLWLQADYILSLKRMTPCFRSLPYTIRENTDKRTPASHDVAEPSADSKERNAMIAELMDEQQKQGETIGMLTAEIREVKEMLRVTLEMQPKLEQDKFNR